MLRLLTSADTEILAAARAVQGLPDDFPTVRCANPHGVPPAEVEAFVDGFVEDARVVVVRLLGGRRAWPEGLAALREACARDGVALILLGGEAEPDAELTALSTAPAGAVAQAGEYLRHGGVENTAQLLRFLADTFALEGHGFADPAALEDWGCYLPGTGDVPVGTVLDGGDPSRPTVAVAFYRTHRVSGNTAWVDDLAAAIDAAGGNPVCVWSYSLRPDAGGAVPVLDALRGRVDALITTVLASGGSTGADGDAPEADGRPGTWSEWDAGAVATLGVPVIQGVCATQTRERWLASDGGLTPLDAAMQVALPEFDGRIIGPAFTFKVRLDEDSPVGAPLVAYGADEERTARLARLAVRHARLGKTPPAERKVAVMLSSFPTKHARIGNAVGLDTPASAVALLEALQAAGYAAEQPFADGDALIHALIDAGGYDEDRLTDAQLAAAPGRLATSTYAEWFAALPQSLQDSVTERWGPAPGERYLDQGDFVAAGLQLGNVFVGIQPPRGYGDDAVAIYHDQELPPAHHYLAVYWWLDRVWGADAIVHLGKHGTLEWLPGKAIGLSDACAPDAVLGDVPFVYPFVVNDPGEGVQAKRRAHAVIVDHLVPPMMRAETYDELAELEQLLDEYARCEALDPVKLPQLATRIWTLLHDADLHHDLGVSERPEDDEFGALIEHVDGYLCEIKDLQVRDGLHILGRVPEGPQHLGLLAAILRLGSGDRVPGLRRAIGAALGLDEPALVDAPGARLADLGVVVPVRLDRGDVFTAGDLVDRLDAVQAGLLEALAADGFAPAAVGPAVAAALGTADAGVVAALRFACEEVVPRLAGTAGEIDAVLAVLDGRHLPSGPSGSPTRGRVDVLPTGRNFYSVDPKSVPGELAYDTGRRLADALLARHVADDGAHPETVGIVMWGTAAMRTHGDDAGEILSLLGVRPTWNRESRRVTGLDVIPLDELGRPRIDVTVRLSGFFRDAFPGVVALLDEAVRIVAALDEPVEQNFVRKHVLADAERLAEELGADAALRRATTRLFGPAPGAYGAGLLQLIEAKTWRDGADLAQVYEAWGGHAYGKGLDGRAAPEAMRDAFGRIDVAVKNVDTREHDLLDSDDYFQEHGGMVAYVQHLTGKAPRAQIGDSADPERVQSRALAEEARRVFRARVANPRWIAGMIRHGYKGAFELSATVDYLFGYDATTGVVEDWMYEQLAEKYVLDEDVAAFMRKSNPWALQAIAERLLEAEGRGMWAAKPETVEGLRAAFLEVDDALEGVATP